jgi:hypothetical protein
MSKMFDLHPRDQPPGCVDQFALVKRLGRRFIQIIKNDEKNIYCVEINIEYDAKIEKWSTAMPSNERNPGGADSRQTIDWEREARRIIKSLMARHDCSAKRLSLLLELQGIEIESRALSNRINRGTFSFAFFLQIARCLDVDKVDVRAISRR